MLSLSSRCASSRARVLRLVCRCLSVLRALQLGAGREQEERVLEVMLEHEVRRSAHSLLRYATSDARCHAPSQLEGDVQDAGKHGLRVKCDPKLGGRMRDALLAADIPVESFELDRAPQVHRDCSARRIPRTHGDCGTRRPTWTSQTMTRFSHSSLCWTRWRTMTTYSVCSTTPPSMASH